MASYNMNQVRTGLKVIENGEPNVIISCDFIKPGKGQAFTRVKMRNLLNGRVNEKTCKPSDLLEGADVVETSMQYLYTDGQHWFFMNPDTYDQVEADAAALGGAEQWIKEEDVCSVTLWNGHPILVAAPNFVIREVVETDPGLKGRHLERRQQAGEARDRRGGQGAALHPDRRVHPGRHPDRGVRLPRQGLTP